MNNRHAMWFVNSIPTLVGLGIMALLGFLYHTRPDDYFSVMRWIGVPAFRFPFVDGEFIYTMKQCWDRGVDIYVSIPCDTFPGNKMPYSPLWPRLPLPSDKDLYRVPVGILSGVLFFLSLLLLPPRKKTAIEAAILTLGALSTSVIFVIERNNADLWLYLLVVTAIVLLARGPVWRLVGYGMIMLAGLLKYYPLAALAVALRERSRFFLVVAALSAMALIVFVGTLHDEILSSLANVPRSVAISDMVGIVNLPRVAAIALQRFGLSQSAIGATTFGMRLALTLLILALAWKTSRRPDLRDAFARSTNSDSNWLIVGSCLMAGCYLAGASYGYRGVFFVPVLGGLLAIRRSADERTRAALLAMALIVALTMSMDGVRASIGMGLAGVGFGETIQTLARSAILLARELLWIYVCQLMIGFLFIFIEASPAFADLFLHAGKAAKRSR